VPKFRPHAPHSFKEIETPEPPIELVEITVVEQSADRGL